MIKRFSVGATSLALAAVLFVRATKADYDLMQSLKLAPSSRSIARDAMRSANMTQAVTRRRHRSAWSSHAIRHRISPRRWRKA